MVATGYGVFHRLTWEGKLIGGLAIHLDQVSFSNDCLAFSAKGLITAELATSQFSVQSTCLPTAASRKTPCLTSISTYPYGGGADNMSMGCAFKLTVFFQKKSLQNYCLHFEQSCMLTKGPGAVSNVHVYKP